MRVCKGSCNLTHQFPYSAIVDDLPNFHMTPKMMGTMCQIARPLTHDSLFSVETKKPRQSVSGLMVFLERVTGLQIFAAQNLWNPAQIDRLLRRFPKNVPLARFLHGNPPHRLDFLSLFEIKKTKVGSLFNSQCLDHGDGTTTWTDLPIRIHPNHHNIQIEPATCSLSKGRHLLNKGFPPRPRQH